MFRHKAGHSVKELCRGFIIYENQITFENLKKWNEIFRPCFLWQQEVEARRLLLRHLSGDLRVSH